MTEERGRVILGIFLGDDEVSCDKAWEYDMDWIIDQVVENKHEALSFPCEDRLYVFADRDSCLAALNLLGDALEDITEETDGRAFRYSVLTDAQYKRYRDTR